MALGALSLTQSQIYASKGIAYRLVVILAAIFVAGVFAMGFDQGHIFSLALGEQAFDTMYLHELSHDLRHSAGFPCH